MKSRSQKKKVAWLLIAALALLVFAGCGTQPAAEKPKEATKPAEQAKTTEGKLRIALVLPATIDDLAWGQSMHDELRKIQKEMGADKLEVAVSERMGNAVDAGAAIRQYATQGFDIILAHGAQYQSVVSEIAKDFPKTTFAYGTGFKTEANIHAYDPQAQEGAYLLGLLAAKISKTGTVGIVGPVEAGDAIKYNKGFEKGVLAGKADAKVRIAYTGSFNEIVKAGEMAKTHMDAGADVLTGSSQQAVGAVKAVAAKPGAYWLSTDMEQYAIAADTVLAAQVYNWEKVIKQIIELRKQGVVGGKHLTLSFADGTLDFTYNPKLADKVPKEVKDAIEKAKKDIASGTLKVDISK